MPRHTLRHPACLLVKPRRGAGAGQGASTMPPATWQLLMSTGWSTTGGTGAEGGVPGAEGGSGSGSTGGEASCSSFPKVFFLK
jgi:hypothetical protein